MNVKEFIRDIGKEEAMNCWSRHKEQFNNIKTTKTIVRITKERKKKSKQDKE